MQVHLQLTGRTPLVMHNIRLANPDDPITKEIASITSKRQKTEEDRAEIARLEWYGGIYADELGPYVPSTNIRRCLNEAAKVRKLGKDVLRAVIPTEPACHVEYNGPTALDALWKDEMFRLHIAIGVKASATMRCRPMFPKWAVATDFELDTEILDYDKFVAIAKTAGRIEGLGDARILGYGRFVAEVAAV
jgi:hypothetical protein